jgi:predicted transcriptional regulator
MARTRSGGVGERELALLRWVAAQGGATVGEAADGFGAADGLARSTVQTMLERLHEKGFLRRRRQQGVYRYVAAQPAGELLRGLVHSFVEGTLGGSLSPFVAYLVEEGAASPEERAALAQLVERLEERKGES